MTHTLQVKPELIDRIINRSQRYLLYKSNPRYAVNDTLVLNADKFELPVVINSIELEPGLCKGWSSLSFKVNL